MNVSWEISGAGKMSNDAVIYGVITAFTRKDPCVNHCSEHLCVSCRQLPSFTQQSTGEEAHIGELHHRAVFVLNYWAC